MGNCLRNDSYEKLEPLNQNILQNREYKKYKMVVLGDTDVGKTFIINSAVNKINPFNTTPTIGVDFDMLYFIDYVNTDIPYKICMWDTAGRDIYRPMIETYYENTHIFMLVYDATNYTTFMNLQNYINIINKISNKFFIILAANKSNLNSQVSRIQAKNYADENNFYFCEMTDDPIQNRNTLLNILRRIVRKL